MRPLHEEEQKFKKSLKSGRFYGTEMWGEERNVNVRAMGRLSSPQFTMLMRPSDYSNSWLDMDVPVPHVPGHVRHQPFDADHPEYQELEQRIMKEGVRRPVIVGQKQNMYNPDIHLDPNNITVRPAYPVMDGHHRAFFAIKHGLHIPVVQFVSQRSNY